MTDDKMKYIPDHVEDAVVRQEKETGSQIRSFVGDTGLVTRIPGEYGEKDIFGLHDKPINRPIIIDWISILRSLLAAVIAEELEPSSITIGVLEREIIAWCKMNGMSVSRGAAYSEAKLIMDEVQKFR